MRLICFGRAILYGATFHSFCEEEIGKLLAKNIARTARLQLEG